MYERNLVHFRVADTLRAGGLSLVFTIFFLLTQQAILRDWRKSGLLTSLILVQFYSYGHVVNGMERVAVQLVGADPASFLPVIWALLFFLISFLIVRADIRVGTERS